MMARGKNIAPLIVGVLLVAVGSILLAQTLFDFEFDIDWWGILRLLLPSLLILFGLRKLIRHFGWKVEDLQNKRAKSSLLGGLFWTFVGVAALLNVLGEADFSAIAGQFWPLVIVLFGLGKVIDFYRLGGRMQFHGSEIVGLIIVVLLGSFARTIDEAHFGSIDLRLPQARSERDRPFWSSRAHRWEEQRSLDRGQSQTLQIVNIYGDVRVEGNDGDSIEIELAKAVDHRSRRRAEDIAKMIELRIDREGQALKLGTNRRSLDPDYRFRTDLTVSVPRSMNLKVVNGYGLLSVSGIEASCDLENDSGDLAATSIAGPVSLKNRYQPIRASRIAGSLTIVNRRGEVEVRRASGRVSITTERKGVEVRNSDGDVSVRNYHGSVYLEDINGAVDIDAVGSSIEAYDIAKRATVKNSYENVRIERLQDGLTLITENCDQATIETVQGSVRIESKRSEISARNLEGGLRLEGISTRVEASDIRGPINLATSLRTVEVEEFRGAVEIQNDNGDIRIANSQPVSDNISAENSNGEITLALPSESSFRLMAQSRGGVIESEFGSQTTQESGGLFRISVGQGGPTIQLQTRFAPIRIMKIG